ncbi:MAG: hypothetical protein ACRDIZ_03840 [Actinomycetota bacterium]
MEARRDSEEVWDLIRRADDFVKYSPNRDPAAARAQARRQLERAAEAASALTDPAARDALTEQVQRRLDDLDRAGDDADG